MTARNISFRKGFFRRVLAAFFIFTLAANSVFANSNSENVRATAGVRVAPPRAITATAGQNSATIGWSASLHAVSGSIDSYRIYSKLSTSTDYSDCPPSAEEVAEGKNCSVEYSFSTDASEQFSLELENLSTGNYDFIVRAVKNVAAGDFDSALHESSPDCASCEVQNVAITGEISPESESESESEPDEISSLSSSGGGGSPVAPSSENLHSAAQIVVTKISENKNEINFSIDLPDSSSGTEVGLDIFALENSVVDSRLIEVGYFDENEIWRSPESAEIENSEVVVEVEKDRTITAKIIDAETLANIQNSQIETAKSILPTIEGVIPLAVKIKNGAAEIEIPAETKIRNSNDELFDRVIHAPQIVATPPGQNQNLKIETAVAVGASSGSVIFDQPVKITLPVADNLRAPKLFFLDEFSGEWLLVRDVNSQKFGGEISANEKTIFAFVDHFTIFAVAGVEDSALDELKKKSEEWVPASGKIFRDLPESHWAHDFVVNLKNSKIIDGYPDGSFRPNSEINRAEITKIALAAFRSDADLSVESAFPDVPEDEWFAPFVATAEKFAIVSGYSDGFFRPADFVNRAEAVKILVGAAGFEIDAELESNFIDVTESEWFRPFVALVESRGVVGGHSVELPTFEFSRELRFGKNGDDVGALQFVLRELGFYSGKTSFYFGKLTESALVAFQNQNLAGQNFRVGVLDEITKNKIYAITKINSSRIVREFRPADPITRAEVAKIVAILLDLKELGYSLDATIATLLDDSPIFDLSQIEFENPFLVMPAPILPPTFTSNSIFERLDEIF